MSKLSKEVDNHLNKYSKDNKQERGLSMELISGKPYFPESPLPEDIDIRDIAHSLSLTNRYGGHTRKPYSVAQHSVILSHLVDSGDEFDGLMHDGTEYAVGDIVRPIKYLCPEFGVMENKNWLSFCEKYGVSRILPQSVKNHDVKICYTERRDLMNHTGETDWGGEIEPHDIKIKFWSWRKSRRKFLLRFYELRGVSLLKRILYVAKDEYGYLVNKRFDYGI